MELSNNAMNRIDKTTNKKMQQGINISDKLLLRIIAYEKNSQLKFKVKIDDTFLIAL